jgi:hypothetical protein
LAFIDEILENIWWVLKKKTYNIAISCLKPKIANKI